MSANEFVKKYGLEYAKHIAYEDSVILVDLDYNNLKRIIESHELVENWGGLDDAKFALQLVRYPESLKQAIADVESCLD